MTQQYYTPEIEDLHVGYQCERRKYISDEWVPLTIRWNDPARPANDIDEILYDLSQNRIRTPYLTKEDIEGEGWKHVGSFFRSEPGSEWDRSVDFAMGDYGLLIDPKSRVISIQEVIKRFGTKTNVVRTLYHGSCPSANELILIQKLLKIK